MNILVNITTINDLKYEYFLKDVELEIPDKYVFKIEKHYNEELDENDFKELIIQFQKIYFDTLNQFIKQVDLIINDEIQTYIFEKNPCFIFNCYNYFKSLTGRATIDLLLLRRN